MKILLAIFGIAMFGFTLFTAYKIITGHFAWCFVLLILWLWCEGMDGVKHEMHGSN